MPVSHRHRLFIGSCFAMLSVAFVFAIRGDIMPALGAQFHLNKEEVGMIAGAAFWGFLASILIGGQLCDIFGMGRLLAVSIAGYVTGTALTIWATGFWTLWAATLCVGTANGLVEAAVNPLVATLYPEQKTERLNMVHAWFPAGIGISGLAVYALTKGGFGWQVKMLVVLLPTIVFGFLFAGQKFPSTERVQRGFSTAGMYREALRPLFLIWVFCMLLTASTELGPNQWIPDILTSTAGLQGILVLVWINGVMAVGRLAVERVMKYLSPLALLICAAGLSAVGLLLLSAAQTPVTAIGAATIFGAGVCYFWPTMLGVTAERFPAGGAFLLAVMGAAGNLSVALALPWIGRIYDAHGPRSAFRYVALLPALLIIIFTAIRLYDLSRSRGSQQKKPLTPAKA